MTKLATAPRVVHALAYPRADVHRKLAVASPDGVLIVESDGAYRVGLDLVRHPIAWPGDVHIDAIASVSAGRGGLALIFIQRGDRRVLFLDGERAIAGEHADEMPLAVHDGEIITRSFDGLTRFPIDLKEPPRPLDVSDRIQLDAVEGITWLHAEPHLLVGERGAHWLIDLNGKVLPMPGGATSIWSASMTLRSGRLPFLDEHGQTHAYESGVSWISFSLEPGNELMALPISRGLDEAGVLATNHDSRRFEVRSVGRRLQASTAQRVAWQTVASTTGPYEFAAFPIGDRAWMLLNEDGSEAVMIDGTGRAVATTGAAATVAALSGQPLALWLGLLGVVFGLAFCVPLVIARTARGLDVLDREPPRADHPEARGAFFGTLHVPPGSMLVAGLGRRVALSSGCHLRAGGTPIDLASGPRRLDDGRPLVDGEPIYVVGAVEHDTKGGPMRATHRRKLGPDGARYFIGRGGPADFERDLAAFENFRLIGFALVQLAVALGVLVALGLRPFA